MQIKDFLASKGVLSHVILPPAIDILLQALDTVVAPLDQGGGIYLGSVKLVKDLSKSPIPGFDFNLALPTGVVDPAPCKVKLEPAVGVPTAFKFWVNLAKQGQVYLGFKLVEGLPGLAMTGATIVENPPGTFTLQPIAGSSPMLVSR